MIDLLKQKIDSHQVISFDIFDTLIMRAYERPVDLFAHIEISLGIDSFRAKREQAEKKARALAFKRGADEITIDEIYDLLPKKWAYLKDIEVGQELRVCKQDLRMHAVFEYALNRGKTVVIASDMYLPKNIIEKILEKNGYTGYTHLFLSSDTLRNKVTGNMFRDIMEFSGVAAHEILHIGDNLISDYDSPRAMGIDCFLYESAKKLNIKDDEENFFNTLSSYSDSIPISIAKSLFLIDAPHEKDTWERFGYRYGGLMTYGFCIWLKNHFEKNKVKKAFFMSRDGFIPRKAFSILYPDFITDYFFGSRRAYLFCGMKDIKSILLYLVDQIGNGCSFEEYYNSLCIDNDEIKEKYNEYFNNRIINENDKNKLKEFFIENEYLFKKYAEYERNIAIEYMKKKNFIEENTAIVDIGWSLSIQKNLESTLKLAGFNKKIRGYYLGLHAIKGNYQADSYLMVQGGPPEMAKIICPLISIFELLFTAPHASCVKIGINKKKITPIFQNISIEEASRIDASKKICNGIISFIKDFKEVYEKLPIPISANDAIVPMKDFYINLSEEYAGKLRKIAFVTGIGQIENYQALYPSYNKNDSFGLIFTWPGSTQSGEYEFARRLQIAAKNIGYKVAILSKQGMILDEYFRETLQKVNPDTLKFIISIHFDDYKALDCFYYHALWNPLEILMQHSNASQLLQNVDSNDDFLIYDDGGMKNYIKALLGENQLELDDASSLTASFPDSVARKPTVKKFVLFYCGINWETMIGATPRHESFFKQLDAMDNVRFYGPQRGWLGYKNYRGSIPFDGVSILDEIEDCGVVLALSSYWHYRGGAVTNRLYEGCAAGAVIITDDNPFIKKHFGDAVLYIDFDLERPCRMAEQVKAHLVWIAEHPKEALELAIRAQNIFREKFALEKQIQIIIDNHEKRRQTVARARYAKNNNSKTLVVSFIDGRQFTLHDKKRIRAMVHNIERQYDKSVTLALACSEDLVDSTFSVVEAERSAADIRVIPFRFYNRCNYKQITRSQALYTLIHQIEHDYLMIVNGSERMYFDHITTLKRTLEDHPDYVAAYSRRALDSKEGKSYAFMEGRFEKRSLLDCCFPDNNLNVPGMFLMRASIEEYLEDSMCTYIDGTEVNLLLNLAVFRHERKIAFSGRVTVACVEGFLQDWPKAVELTHQTNFIRALVFDAYDKWKSSHVFLNTHEFTTVDSTTLGITPTIAAPIIKWLKKIYCIKLNIQIIATRSRKLVCWRKKTRQRINQKIKNLRQERKLIKIH